MALPAAPTLNGLQHANIPALDLARAVAFYTEVLGLAVQFQEEGMAMVGNGGADIALCEAKTPLPAGVHFGWRLADKAAVLGWKARLEVAGVKIHHERDDAGYGVYFRDSEGNTIEIYC